MSICKNIHFLFFQLFLLAHLVCASSIPHLHGRTGLLLQIPAQLQSLLCLSHLFFSNLLQVTLQWRVQRERQQNLLQNYPKGRLFLVQLGQMCPFHLLQFQVITQPPFPPNYCAVFDRFCLFHVVELAFVSILMYYNLGQTAPCIPTTLFPSYHGVFGPFARVL